MITTGKYYGDKTYDVIYSQDSFTDNEALIMSDSDNIVSAYQRKGFKELCFNNNKAKDIRNNIIKAAIAHVQKNSLANIPFVLGTAQYHTINYGKRDTIEGDIERFNGDLCGCSIQKTRRDVKGLVTGTERIVLEYTQSASEADLNNLLGRLNMVEIVTKQTGKNNEYAGEEGTRIRSVGEIALSKESTDWLKNKKYFIVDEDSNAEQFFAFLDQYAQTNNIVAYDVESTGLKINMFGGVGSKRAKLLERYNQENPDKRKRVDKLVGIIFCVEPNVSYYFPVGNKKFKNLYVSGEVRDRLITNIKSRYTVGDKWNVVSDIAGYIRDTSYEEFRNDVILMERVRDILERGKIVTHGGGYEQKVGFMYDILINIVHDSLIMHQVMHKFRGTTSNKGEPSNLKYLSKKELGIDQWELKDFFPDWKEEKAEAGAFNRIDFSEMTYEGTMIYAPTDGDCTLQLVMKWLPDLFGTHRDEQYIYYVELKVMIAIAYMEYHGIRIAEEKIAKLEKETEFLMSKLETKFLIEAGLASERLIEASKKLFHEKLGKETYDRVDSECEQIIAERLKNDIAYKEQFVGEGLEWLKEQLPGESDYRTIFEILEEDRDGFNIGSPAQVAKLMYDIKSYPLQSDNSGGFKRSVDKKSIGALCNLKNEDGSSKYPLAAIYRDWVNSKTLLTKFFGRLPDFMYPGGYMFSSFGQIATATGRSSCKNPNLQQMPKNITKIIIPRDDCVFLDADYSQIELRVLYGLSGQMDMIEFMGNPDNDAHTSTASSMFGVKYEEVTKDLRKDAKTMNFGIVYGMGDGSLAIRLHGANNAQTKADATKKRELFFQKLSSVLQYFNVTKEFALVHGYTNTYWNRKRYYNFTAPDGTVNSGIKAAALRQSVNAVIQGCLSGDTRIQTKEHGIVKIKDVVNTEQLVWDGEKWSRGDITFSGKKKKCTITFSTGQKFVCSPEHKFLVRNTEGNDQFIECKDLIGKSSGSTSPHRVVINKIYEESDNAYDQLLVKGIDVKHGIRDEIFRDTAALREYLRSIFDIDGEIIGETISLAFGRRSDFKDTCRDIQKALLFFGIRSRYYDQKDSCNITIEADDNGRFLDVIGFINEEKQKKGREIKCVRDEHIFGKILVVESVEETDEYIDMYDVCNTDGGYYVADGIVTHNTAADIFKIGLARQFEWIKSNGLLGKVFISNIIHDEQLLEINFKQVNVKKALAAVWDNMSFHIEGMPPLYVGAGIGSTWSTAKGGNAEIHPHLMYQFIEESKGENLYEECAYGGGLNEVIEYIDGRNMGFRRDKVVDYLKDSNNFHKKMHPVIGKILLENFNTEGLDPEEQFDLILEKFFEKEGLRFKYGITPDLFTVSDNMEADDEDKEYDDEDEESEAIADIEFGIIEDTYGIRLEDWIKEYKLVASKKLGIVGVDFSGIKRSSLEKIGEYLDERACEKEDEGSMEVVFLMAGGVLKRIGRYVRGLDVFDLQQLIA
jgi:DNA polymerase I-like protein with 3'-5' exonuclease and polymerase domains